MAMTKAVSDLRYGHDLSQVQNGSGVDLLLLKKQLELSVEQRFLNLEKQLEFLSELRDSANNGAKR